jgi:hypothetical protein
MATTKKKTTKKATSKKAPAKKAAPAAKATTKKTTKKKASAKAAPKAAAPKAAAKKETKKAAVKKPRFPRRELISWLKGRSRWNHQDWLALLDELREKGFGYYVDSADQQTVIGQFLEENRK